MHAIVSKNSSSVAKKAFNIDLPDHPTLDINPREEFYNIWRQYAYRMRSDWLEFCQWRWVELCRIGLAPQCAQALREGNLSESYEVGSAHAIFSSTATWDVAPPLDIQNAGLVFQPSLDFGGFPYRNCMTQYFEYEILSSRIPNNNYPIIGFAPAGVYRVVFGGIQWGILLTLSGSKVHLYTAFSKVYEVPCLEGAIGDGSVIGIGITKIPMTCADFDSKVKYQHLQDSNFFRVIFITHNGQLVHSAIAEQSGDFDLHPLVNYYNIAGPDSVNIAGTPACPWRYNLEKHIDTRAWYDILEDKECLNFIKFGDVDFSEGYRPLRARSEPITTATIVNSLSYPLESICFFANPGAPPRLPQYELWDSKSTLAVLNLSHSAALFKNKIVNRAALTKHLERNGYLSTLPPIERWPQSDESLANHISIYSVLSALVLFAENIAISLSDPNWPEDMFIPQQLVLHSKWLLLCPEPQFREQFGDSPEQWNKGFDLYHEAGSYDLFRRQTAMGLKPSWERPNTPFWKYFIPCAALLRTLKGWKISMKASDMEEFSDNLLEKLGPSDSKLTYFIVSVFCRLPFSLLPWEPQSRHNAESLLYPVLAALYDARAVIRSSYTKDKKDIAAYAKELAHGLDSIVPASKEDLGQTPRNLAIGLLWMYGDIPEVNDIFDLHMPKKGLFERMGQFVTDLIWEPSIYDL